MSGTIVLVPTPVPPQPRLEYGFTFRYTNVIQIDTQEETDMRSINVRDLRLRSAQVWRQLAEEKELVVRSKGKSVAVLSATTEDMLETTLTALRRARALQAVMALQMESARVGKDRLTLDDINKEIGAVRQSRQP